MCDISGLNNGGTCGDELWPVCGSTNMTAPNENTTAGAAPASLCSVTCGITSSRRMLAENVDVEEEVSPVRADSGFFSSLVSEGPRSARRRRLQISYQIALDFRTSQITTMLPKQDMARVA